MCSSEKVRNNRADFRSLVLVTPASPELLLKYSPIQKVIGAPFDKATDNTKTTDQQIAEFVHVQQRSISCVAATHEVPKCQANKSFRTYNRLWSSISKLPTHGSFQCVPQGKVMMVRRCVRVDCLNYIGVGGIVQGVCPIDRESFKTLDRTVTVWTDFFIFRLFFCGSSLNRYATGSLYREQRRRELQEITNVELDRAKFGGLSETVSTAAAFLS